MVTLLLSVSIIPIYAFQTKHFLSARQASFLQCLV